MSAPSSGARKAWFAPDGGVRIVPSLLAADVGDLAGALRAAETAGADWVSVDVMDGHFVPNLSFGPDHVRALKPRTSMLLDAHLMVERPGRFAADFVRAGAGVVTAHVEACPRPGSLLREIRGLGAGAGLALKPATPASAVLEHLDRLDLVLVMTVEPGFGGQAFLPRMLPKIRELRGAISRRGLSAWLMADGGIDARTAALAAGAGADALVAGTAFYRARDPEAAFRELSRTARRAYAARG